MNWIPDINVADHLLKGIMDEEQKQYLKIIEGNVGGKRFIEKEMFAKIF